MSSTKICVQFTEKNTHHSIKAIDILNLMGYIERVHLQHMVTNETGVNNLKEHHIHGKDEVLGSNPSRGSRRLFNRLSTVIFYIQSDRH